MKKKGDTDPVGGVEPRLSDPEGGPQYLDDEEVPANETWIQKFKRMYAPQIPVKLKQVRKGRFLGSVVLQTTLLIAFVTILVFELTSCTETRYISLEFAKSNTRTDTTECLTVSIQSSGTFLMTDNGLWDTSPSYVYSDTVFSTQLNQFEADDDTFADNMIKFQHDLGNYSVDFRTNTYRDNLLAVMGYRNGTANSSMSTVFELDLSHILEPVFFDAYLDSPECSLFNEDSSTATMTEAESVGLRYSVVSHLEIEDTELVLSMDIDYEGFDADFGFDAERDCPAGFTGDAAQGSMTCKLDIDVNVMLMAAALNEEHADPSEELLSDGNSSVRFFARRFKSGQNIILYKGDYYVTGRGGRMLFIELEHHADSLCADCDGPSLGTCYDNDFDVIVNTSPFVYSQVKDDAQENPFVTSNSSFSCNLLSHFFTLPQEQKSLGSCPTDELEAYGSCEASWLADGYCDAMNNNPCCSYDGGDCCATTCQDSTYTCGVVGFSCCEEVAACSASCDSELSGNACNQYLGDIYAIGGGGSYFDDDGFSYGFGYYDDFFGDDYYNGSRKLTGEHSDYSAPVSLTARKSVSRAGHASTQSQAMREKFQANAKAKVKAMHAEESESDEAGRALRQYQQECSHAGGTAAKTRCVRDKVLEARAATRTTVLTRLQSEREQKRETRKVQDAIRQHEVTEARKAMKEYLAGEASASPKEVRKNARREKLQAHGREDHARTTATEDEQAAVRRTSYPLRASGPERHAQETATVAHAMDSANHRRLDQCDSAEFAQQSDFLPNASDPYVGYPRIYIGQHGYAVCADNMNSFDDLDQNSNGKYIDENLAFFDKRDRVTEEQTSDALCSAFCQLRNPSEGTSLRGIGVADDGFLNYRSFFNSSIYDTSNLSYVQLDPRLNEIEDDNNQTTLSLIENEEVGVDYTSLLNSTHTSYLSCVEPGECNSTLLCMCYQEVPSTGLGWNLRVQSETRFLNSEFYELGIRKMHCTNPFREVAYAETPPVQLEENFFDCSTKACPTFFAALGSAFANSSSLHDILLVFIIWTIIQYNVKVLGEQINVADDDDVEMELFQIASASLRRRAETGEGLDDLISPDKVDGQAEETLSPKQGDRKKMVGQQA